MIEGKIRLLVVEDSKTQALQLKNDLKKHGFEVVLAFDANQALEILENEEFKIIISDVVMPGMDGFEFCKQVKKKFKKKINIHNFTNSIKRA